MDSQNFVIKDRQIIRDVNGKTKDEIDKDIDVIIEWFVTQKHLPETPSRNMIEMFLVNSKFSIEETKKFCDMYYTSRKLIPEMFMYCNPSIPEQKVYFNEIVYFIPLPKLTKNFYNVNLISFRDFYYPSFNLYQVLAQIQIVFEILVQEDLNMGDIIIIDFKYFKKEYALKITPVQLKMVTFCLEHLWTKRVKGVHFVNIPTYAEFLINLVKTILKKKILERLHLHDSYEKLYEFVPKEILPKDYGGEEKSLDELNDLWKEKFQKYQSHFDHLQTLEVNESLKPEPLVNSDILGYYGNFKKIDVD